MSRISIESLTEMQKLLDNLDDQEHDNLFWKPLNDDDSIKEFDEHIRLIKESKSWDRKYNHKKGGVLEDFAMFLFKRFPSPTVDKNKRPGDNETDIESTLSDKHRYPPFINDKMGTKFVCECKNKKTTAIDVTMVAKLSEILPTRGSNFGIFISIIGMGGHGWRYGEGKRKKIMYSEQRPIISITVKELEKLREGANFYTMIKQKYDYLIDEVEDETGDIPPADHDEYTKRLNEVVSHLRKCELINEEEFGQINTRITNKYGNE
ncbi:hypothetical protein [Halobacillus seohaensis]|uniref:Restriction endonuclease n=1 Tax=Halobacillus seohaensis TaxID=447421 RepID=A0ABW2ENQ7_9BACI